MRPIADGPDEFDARSDLPEFLLGHFDEIVRVALPRGKGIAQRRCGFFRDRLVTGHLPIIKGFGRDANQGMLRPSSWGSR
jgi:hypothetical protein